MSVNVKEKSREFNKVELYLMTLAPDITPLKDIEDGTSVTIDGWLIFEDIDDKTGESKEILSIITPDKLVYSGQSSTFAKSLKDIDFVMDEQKYSILKISGKTKAGRDYINCTLDVNSIII